MKKRLNSKQKGLATIEALPLLVIFVVLISYAMGLWGAIHSAALSSIAARTYAFSTFRNRAYLHLFREKVGAGEQVVHTKDGVRFHWNQSELRPADNNSAFAITRPLVFGRTPSGEALGSETDHNEKIYSIDEGKPRKRNKTVGVNPIWIMVGYGMCLDAKCGDEK